MNDLIDDSDDGTPEPPRTIYCTGCEADVQARLTSGAEVYSHRPDLARLPFWKCDQCGNFVGCHHKTSEPTTPLGCIPTPEIKKVRGHIHRILDPIWKTKKMKRRQLYREIARRIGVDEYHTAEIRTVEDARRVWQAIHDLRTERGWARL